MEFLVKFASAFMGVFQLGGQQFMGWVTGIIPTIRGGIGVSFRQTDDGLDLTVTVPSGATATVYLPDGRVKTVGAGILSFLA